MAESWFRNKPRSNSIMSMLGVPQPGQMGSPPSWGNSNYPPISSPFPYSPRPLPQWPEQPQPQPRALAPSMPTPLSLGLPPPNYGNDGDDGPPNGNNPEDISWSQAKERGIPQTIAKVAAVFAPPPFNAIASMLGLSGVMDADFGGFGDPNFNVDEEEGFGGGYGGPGGVGDAGFGEPGGYGDFGDDLGEEVGGPGAPDDFGDQGTSEGDDDDGGTGGDDGNDNEGNDGSADGGDSYAKGGIVKGLLGNDPPGPDDGYGTLDKGEYVIRADAVKHYGTDFFERLNERKILKKSARGLLG